MIFGRRPSDRHRPLLRRQPNPGEVHLGFDGRLYAWNDAAHSWDELYVKVYSYARGYTPVFPGEDGEDTDPHATDPEGDTDPGESVP